MAAEDRERLESALTRRWLDLRDLLDERSRRLWLAAEARSLGYGGIAFVAGVTRVTTEAIAEGIKELSGAKPLAEGVRRPGGGRKKAEVSDPALPAALDALVEPVTRGDPESPLRWTGKSLTKLADDLSAGGHRVGVHVVRRLLREAGYSLQADAKTIEGAQSPDRDPQFQHIHDLVLTALAARQPVISVDTEKKELVGPHGVFDVGANAGWVSVGTDHDTAAFAVNAIRTWWSRVGRARYPDAAEVLIIGDCGGSNGNRVRLWKKELAAFAAETGLAIRLAHLPPGTSKWSRIEHKLFSCSSMNWRGGPVTSHEVIVNTISPTTTATGLTGTAELDTAAHPKGIKISDRDTKELEAAQITRHAFRPDWNYTIYPSSTAKITAAPTGDVDSD
ncbi:ISAzo13 family transposase [Nonomuraea basaltis]|uniref:ISAzo13 family transposase n=1 Tax=Nonomuraea basaltis TaxID=2495887 RepID=UPI00110C49E7|nr:ISAzo13 family transposase [Nonomuraea basaltis]TMR96006.1 ISAzo13 family transposase [Nonomuraea basaltis]